jgi:hypothetical protein
MRRDVDSTKKLGKAEEEETVGSSTRTWCSCLGRQTETRKVRRRSGTVSSLAFKRLHRPSIEVISTVKASLLVLFARHHGFAGLVYE